MWRRHGRTPSLVLALLLAVSHVASQTSPSPESGSSPSPPPPPPLVANFIFANLTNLLNDTANGNAAAIGSGSFGFQTTAPYMQSSTAMLVAGQGPFRGITWNPTAPVPDPSQPYTMLLLSDFTDSAPFVVPAGAQAAGGSRHGHSWDAWGLCLRTARRCVAPPVPNRVITQVVHSGAYQHTYRISIPQTAPVIQQACPLRQYLGRRTMPCFT